MLGIEFAPSTRLKLVVASSVVAVQTSATALCAWFTEVHVLIGAACRVAASAHPLLYTLLILQTVDVVTGMMASRAGRNRIRSSKFSAGIRKKLTMVLIVGVAALLDKTMAGQFGLDSSTLLFTWSAAWYVAVEVLSIYENAMRLGVPFPPFLKQLAERVLEKQGPADGTVNSK